MGDEEEKGSRSRRMLIVVTTTRSDGGVRQRRNAALAHVEKHRLFSVVHFAHASGVYDAYFFDEIRQIERCHGRSPPPGASLASCVCVVVVEGNDPAAVGSQEIAVPYRYTRYSSTCSRRKLGHGDVEEDEAEPSSPVGRHHIRARDWVSGRRETPPQPRRETAAVLLSSSSSPIHLPRRDDAAAAIPNPHVCSVRACYATRAAASNSLPITGSIGLGDWEQDYRLV
ncbi:hypothetical protein OsJ_16620 [Oryza sativa Japonica Group]|uniref:Glycosyltransferases n=1 Tax=Oryza sativa subsp. japonica TaxID=39947 RepID=B9FDA6_ORYSJ|nr:hypothetical protein OsJ_16620 [Oryza sativa Japonica Group]